MRALTPALLIAHIVSACGSSEHNNASERSHFDDINTSSAADLYDMVTSQADTSGCLRAYRAPTEQRQFDLRRSATSIEKIEQTIINANQDLFEGSFTVWLDVIGEGVIGLKSLESCEDSHVASPQSLLPDYSFLYEIDLIDVNNPEVYIQDLVPIYPSCGAEFVASSGDVEKLWPAVLPKDEDATSVINDVTLEDKVQGLQHLHLRTTSSCKVLSERWLEVAPHVDVVFYDVDSK